MQIDFIYLVTSLVHKIIWMIYSLELIGEDKPQDEPRIV